METTKFISPKSAKEILQRALKIIEEHGWTKRTFKNRKGCFCSIGAINFAANGDATGFRHGGQKTITLYHDARDIFYKAISPPWLLKNGIAGWNDSTARTKEEVIAAFKRAIRIASKKLI